MLRQEAQALPKPRAGEKQLLSRDLTRRGLHAEISVEYVGPANYRTHNFLSTLLILECNLKLTRRPYQVGCVGQPNLGPDLSALLSVSHHDIGVTSTCTKNSKNLDSGLLGEGVKSATDASFVW